MSVILKWIDKHIIIFQFKFLIETDIIHKNTSSLGSIVIFKDAKRS